GAIGPPKPGEDDDDLRTQLAIYVIEDLKPFVLLVHIVYMDATEHHYGPKSAQAASSLEGCDKRIGAMIAALSKAGLAGNTDVFIVSDHGFLTVHRVIHPNTLLVRAGLLTAGAKGNITGGKIDTVSNGGSFFIYWPPKGDLRTAVKSALKPLINQGLLWGVLGPQALRELGADPHAQLALEAPRGAMFDGAATGPLVSSRPEGGSHGYLPFRQGLAASFIAWGPDIKTSVDLHRIRMTSVGPTILKAMGINDPDFGGGPALTGLWRQARPVRIRRR
ncbi:MAG: alkaline phosphatase family protein, partial [Terriglobia bacterium]